MAVNRILLVAALLATSCNSSGALASPSASPTSFTPPLAAACQPPSPAAPSASAPGLSEIQGRAPGGELWALVFHNMPIQASVETKIVWRMTGRGSFHIAPRHTDGSMARLTFGPEAHGGSTWVKPGDEWGTGFIFPEAGCWRIHAQRADLAGDVYLLVSR